MRREEGPLLTTAEAARRAEVDDLTIARLVERGLLREHRTLWGSPRYVESEVLAVLAEYDDEVRRRRTELADTLEQALRLRRLAEWLVSLDRADMAHVRQNVTLRLVIDRARDAIVGDDPGAPGTSPGGGHTPPDTLRRRP